MTEEQLNQYLEKIDSVISEGKYKDNWQSLSEYPVAEWYKQAKLGIFIHWGVFTVPEYHNEWYPRLMYYKGNPVYYHHIKKYGKDFNYRNFIPMFTAEKFDADNWAKLLKSTGAKFIMPVGEHHDGFKLYDTDLSEWTSVNMGPKRDILGELKTAFEKNGLIFSTSSHRSEHFWFFNGGATLGYKNETQDEKYRELYGPCHNIFKQNNVRTLNYTEYGINPTEKWMKDWLVSSCDLIDRYRPSSLFFDWWISNKSFRPYVKKFLAYYYNRSLEWGKEVCVNYKSDAIMYNCAIFDRERGQLENASPYIWQSETSTSYNSWSYSTSNKFKTPELIACNFLDVISKNGCFVINFGPKADGTFCKEELNIIKRLGEFTKRNEEAIWGTQPYKLYGEGKKQKGGSFKDNFSYTSKDYRFTCKTGVVYAFALKPQGKSEFKIKTLAETGDTFHCIIKNITLLGNDEKLTFEQKGKYLKIKLSKEYTDSMPICFKVEVD